MEKIYIKNQQELDNLPLDYNGQIVIDFGVVSMPAKINNKYKKPIQIRTNHCAYVYGYAEVEAYGKAYIEAFDNSYVLAYHNTTVLLSDKATAKAYDKARVLAFDRTYGEACNNVIVQAYDSSHIKACDNVEVKAFNGCTVDAYDDVTVRKHDHCTVNTPNSNVHGKVKVINENSKSKKSYVTEDETTFSFENNTFIFNQRGSNSSVVGYVENYFQGNN